MEVVIALLRVVYFACIITMGIYTSGQLYLLLIFIWHFFFKRQHGHDEQPATRSDIVGLPRVTVQLPLFNERYVARRLIDAVAALDYPRDRLHIQVLDDSTDDTTELIQGRVTQLQADGLRIDIVRRPIRTGYKAGALAYGLTLTDGEIIAIFDADFVPAKDFLLRTVPQFLTDEHIGVIQTRWGHLNDTDNLLTRSQALAIDGHFAIEQYARSVGNLTLNFNGTCGLWRRTCIEDAGGWQWDTLTEDFDLSYRAQIRGWRFLFLRDVVVPGEIPAQIAVYKQQQARWAQGSTQVLIKLFLPLISSRLSIQKRLMGMLQLFQYAIQPVMLVTLMLTPLMLLTHSISGSNLTPLGIIGLGVPLLYAMSQYALYTDWAYRSLFFPALMVFSSGMTVNNSRAALAAFLHRPGEFKRTPKHRLDSTPESWISDLYIALPSRDLLWEVVFGFYTLLGAMIAQAVAPAFLLYFLLYCTSFFSIAGWSLADRWVLLHPAHPASTVEAEVLGQPGR